MDKGIDIYRWMFSRLPVATTPPYALRAIRFTGEGMWLSDIRCNFISLQSQKNTSPFPNWIREGGEEDNYDYGGRMY